MNLWHARQKSQEWLSAELVDQNALVDKGFEILDKCIAFLNQRSKTSNDELSCPFCGRYWRSV